MSEQYPKCGWDEAQAARLAELDELTNQYGGREMTEHGRKMPAALREERTVLERAHAVHRDTCGAGDVAVPPEPTEVSWQEALEDVPDEDLEEEYKRRLLEAGLPLPVTAAEVNTLTEDQAVDLLHTARTGSHFRIPEGLYEHREVEAMLSAVRDSALDAERETVALNKEDSDGDGELPTPGQGDVPGVQSQGGKKGHGAGAAVQAGQTGEKPDGKAPQGKA